MEGPLERMQTREAMRIRKLKENISDAKEYINDAKYIEKYMF